MNILISGGTGFVGEHLIQELVKKEHQIFIATRSPDQPSQHANLSFISYDALDHLQAIDVVINLAGESLFGYWTKKKKNAILSSRIETTRKLIAFMEETNRPPATFISGSAVGFYGMSDDKMFTEETTTTGDDFLAEVARSWETEASRAESLGIRTVYTRFGVILGNGGAFPLMQLPVKWFAGGKVGSGSQWISWIHITDAVRTIIECVENDQLYGPVNVTAPNPVRNDHLMKAIATSLRRPYWIPAPKSGMRLLLGEMSTLLTDGQYVLPRKMNGLHSFSFMYPTIERALEHLHGKSSPESF